MKKILLVCAAGMSTSLLVQKMEKAAQDAGEEVEIQALSVTEAPKLIDTVDIVLLGPQVKYQQESIEKLAGGRIPVEVIDMRDYGTMNGEKVLKETLEKLK